MQSNPVKVAIPKHSHGSRDTLYLKLVGSYFDLCVSNPKVAIMVEADGGVQVLNAACAYPYTEDALLKIRRDIYLNAPSMDSSDVLSSGRTVHIVSELIQFKFTTWRSQEVPAQFGTKRLAQNITEPPSSDLAGSNDNGRVGRGDASRCFDVDPAHMFVRASLNLYTSNSD